jgi:hypothetical protein
MSALPTTDSRITTQKAKTILSHRVSAGALGAWRETLHDVGYMAAIGIGTFENIAAADISTGPVGPDLASSITSPLREDEEAV